MKIELSDKVSTAYFNYKKELKKLNENMLSCLDLADKFQEKYSFDKKLISLSGQYQLNFEKIRRLLKKEESVEVSVAVDKVEFALISLETSEEMLAISLCIDHHEKKSSNNPIFLDGKLDESIKSTLDSGTMSFKAEKEYTCLNRKLLAKYKIPFGMGYMDKLNDLATNQEIDELDALSLETKIKKFKQEIQISYLVKGFVSYLKK